MFNPSVKIFGSHCWDLIDSPANTKILISYEGDKLFQPPYLHFVTRLWEENETPALDCRCNSVAATATWAAGKPVPSLTSVCSCGVSVPPLLLLFLLPRRGAAQILLLPPQGRSITFSLWAGRAARLLPCQRFQGLCLVLGMLVERFHIFWFYFRA